MTEERFHWHPTLNKAQEWYESIETFTSKDFRQEAETQSWLWLLSWAETNYRSYRTSTEKQQRQQTLWQQRGLLERTKANLRSVRDIYKDNAKIAASLTGTIAGISALIEFNKQAMRNL